MELENEQKLVARLVARIYGSNTYNSISIKFKKLLFNCEFRRDILMFLIRDALQHIYLNNLL